MANYRRRRILVLIVALGISIISSEIFIDIAPSMEPRTAVFMKYLVYVLDFVVAWIAMKLNGIHLNIDFKNIRQYIVGIVMCLILLTIVTMLGIMSGMPTGGGINPIAMKKLAYELFFYLCFVGPSEELMSRVFVQETLIQIFPTKKVLMIILGSLIFGLQHWSISNGSWITVILSACIGLYFGLAKEYIKNCTFISLSICHGLYNALNEFIPLFL